MISLQLQKSPRMAPLQKPPLILRILLTSVAIVVMFTVMKAVQAESRMINESGIQDAGWDFTTRWH